MAHFDFIANWNWRRYSDAQLIAIYCLYRAARRENLQGAYYRRWGRWRVRDL